MKRVRQAFIGAIAAATIAGSAMAGVGITMIHEANGSMTGTLNGQGFATSNFVVTGIGQTSDRTSFGSGFFIEYLSASISIDSLGTFDILSPIGTFVNNSSQLVGLSRSNGGNVDLDLFNGPNNAAFATWDMTTSIGPHSGSGGVIQWSSMPQIETSGGILIFDDATVNATFTAIVPAPGAIALLGLLAPIAGRRRRRV